MRGSQQDSVWWAVAWQVDRALASRSSEGIQGGALLSDPMQCIGPFLTFYHRQQAGTEVSAHRSGNGKGSDGPNAPPVLVLGFMRVRPHV
jgi:hypothetical protein